MVIDWLHVSSCNNINRLWIQRWIRWLESCDVEICLCDWYWFDCSHWIICKGILSVIIVVIVKVVVDYVRWLRSVIAEGRCCKCDSEVIAGKGECVVSKEEWLSNVDFAIGEFIDADEIGLWCVWCSCDRRGKWYAYVIINERAILHCECLEI